jgi:hypothetical protein
MIAPATIPTLCIKPDYMLEKKRSLIAVRLPWRRVGVWRQVAKTALQYWPIQRGRILR